MLSLRIIPYVRTLHQNNNPESIAQQFNVEKPIPLFKANYNIAPTQNEVSIRLKAESSKRECALLKWASIPDLAKEAKFGNQFYQRQV